MRQNLQAAGVLLAFLSVGSGVAYETVVGVVDRPAARVKDRYHALGAAVVRILVFCVSQSRK